MAADLLPYAVLVGLLLRISYIAAKEITEIFFGWRMAVRHRRPTIHVEQLKSHI